MIMINGTVLILIALLLIVWFLWHSMVPRVWYSVCTSTLSSVGASHKYQDVRSFVSLFVVNAITIMVLNLLGLIDIISPTSSYTLVLTLAWLVLVSVGSVGLYHLGVRTLMMFTLPSSFVVGMVVFSFLEVFSNLFRIASLSFRLFANILSGHLILHLVFGMVVYTIFVSSIGTIGSVLLLAMLSSLEVVMSLVQVYVFTMLSGVYVTEL